MAYYLLPVDRPQCRECGKRATHRMWCSGTDPRGYYCARCGKVAMHALNKPTADVIPPPEPSARVALEVPNA